jgi:hypothetical protein
MSNEPILCTVCNGQLFPSEILFCQEQATKYERELVYTHPACFSQSMRQRLNQTDVILTREEFDRLNAANKLLISIDKDKHLDVKDAEVQAELYLKGKSFEEYSRMLARMEACCSVWSAAALKFRRNVGIVSDDEKEQIEQARKQRHEKKTKELLNQAGAIRAEGNILTPSTAKKKAKKILTQDEKAIAAFMEIGLSEEDATAKVQEIRAKKQVQNA